MQLATAQPCYFKSSQLSYISELHITKLFTLHLFKLELALSLIWLNRIQGGMGFSSKIFSNQK